MRDYFRFSGRLNRKPYMLRTLLIYAIFIVSSLPLVLVAQRVPNVEHGPDVPAIAAVAVFGVVFVVGCIVLTMMSLRRLHDRDKSGWWLLFFMGAPFLIEVGAMVVGTPATMLTGAIANLAISTWFLVEVVFLRGTDGPNDYGPDPLKAPLDAEIFA